MSLASFRLLQREMMWGSKKTGQNVSRKGYSIFLDRPQKIGTIPEKTGRVATLHMELAWITKNRRWHIKGRVHRFSASFPCASHRLIFFMSMNTWAHSIKFLLSRTRENMWACSDLHNCTILSGAICQWRIIFVIHLQVRKYRCYGRSTRTVT